MNKNEETPTTIENDSNPPQIIPFFSDRILGLADDVFTYVMNELNGGCWKDEFEELPVSEKNALYIAIADAFSDNPQD
jgi:hypothetical protein